MCINTTLTQTQEWNGRFGAQHDKLIQLWVGYTSASSANSCILGKVYLYPIYQECFSQPLRLLMPSSPPGLKAHSWLLKRSSINPAVLACMREKSRSDSIASEKQTHLCAECILVVLLLVNRGVSSVNAITTGACNAL